MKKSKGFTIIELLVVMVIGAIFLLTVGVISIIGIRSYDNYRRESQVYNDISYGFELIKNRLRNSIYVPHIINPSGWSNCLAVGNNVFGLRGGDFVYATGSPPVIQNIILENIVGAGFAISPNPINNSKDITVTISGTKDGESFNLSTTITRRNL